MKQIIIVLLLAGIPLLYVTCDNAVSSIENTAAPAWTAAPTVEAEAGGYTITAGTATGSPEPLVSYYVAPDGTELPTDVTSETAWTESGFSEANAGANATVDSEGKTGGAPGALNLYAVAANSTGHAITSSITFAVNTAAVRPSVEAGNGVELSSESNNNGQFTVTKVGTFLGTPVPSVKYYYAKRSLEDTAPEDAPWPGKEWPADWTAISDVSKPVPADEGDYSLYAVLSNYAGSVKTGDPATNDPIRFTVISPVRPAWTAEPTVTAEVGGYTITAGTVTGSPEPLVSYYVAPDGTELPTDKTSEAEWIASGFSEANVGANATVNGGAPGALNLYAVAVNSAGQATTNSINFAVNTAAVRPSVEAGNHVVVDTSIHGEFTVRSYGPVQGTPAPTITFYYAPRSQENTAPEDAPWPGNDWPDDWTEILEADHGKQVSILPGDYTLYMVMTNYAGSVKTGNADTDAPIQFTVRSSAPAWTSEPMVSVEAGGYIITEGIVTGRPEPSVSYYVATDGTAPPSDKTSEAAWTTNGYSKANVGANATVNGGAPGALNLYAVAINSEGYAITNRIDFAVNTAAARPSLESGKGIMLNLDIDGQFTVTEAGTVLGTPVPSVKYYYAPRNQESTAPEDAPWPGNAWPAVWTEISDLSMPVTVTPGDYTLYIAMSNYAGSVKSGDPDDNDAPIRFTVSSPAPAWTDEPTVLEEAGGYTITAGTATGSPEPLVSYYVATDGTPLPSDVTSEAEWIASGFSAANAGGNAVVNADKTTGGAPGALNLYAVAINSAGHVITNSIDFAVNTAAERPVVEAGNNVTIDTSSPGQFRIVSYGFGQGTPPPTIVFYYAPLKQESTAPEDAPWPGNAWPESWTKILRADHDKTVTVTPGDYTLYMVMTNYAGSVKTGNADTNAPIRFTVTSSAPAWTAEPTVSAEVGGYTITAGTVTGSPEPLVSYYVASDGTALPSDVTSEAEWIASGFSAAKAGANATVDSDGSTGGAPGALNLYAAAVSSTGHAITNRIDFEVNTAAVPPSLESGVELSPDKLGQFTVTEAGTVLGTPVPSVKYYYAAESLENTAPDDAPWPGKEWPTVWTEISDISNPISVNAGNYSLYIVMSNYAGSVKSGDPDDSDAPIRFTVKSPVPAWTTYPTVAAEVGGYTITAGTVTGRPEPLVSYYVAPDGTGLPSDETSEATWTARGFSAASVGANATVDSNGATGGAPGALNLYAVAVNSEGHKRTNRIDFAVNTAAERPYLEPGNGIELSPDTAGQFTVTKPGIVQGEPVPSIKYYYAPRNLEDTAPDDAYWPGNAWPEGWTEIPDISKPVTVNAGDYSLYIVMTNYAGSVRSGDNDALNNIPIRFTVTSPVQPAWTAEPTVAAEAGGYTITAGTVTGNPEPLVSYYVAPDGTGLPSDETSETEWTASGFSAAKTGANAIVNSDGSTGGAPGALNLYAVAVNSVGHKRTNSIDFAVSTAAERPFLEPGNGIELSPDTVGQFTVTRAGIVLGEPASSIKYYYAPENQESTAPADAPWPGNDWPAVWTEISDINSPVTVAPGDYSLYISMTNYAGSVKSGDPDNNDAPIHFTVFSPVPTWTSEPTVLEEAGGYTITAGTVTGRPEPLVSYYVALDGATLPTDETSEAAWTTNGFSVAKAGGNAIVNSDGTTGGNPGDMDLYAVAVNSEGHKRTNRIDFAVNTAAVLPYIAGGNGVAAIPSPGWFYCDLGNQAGNPKPNYTIYYTPRDQEHTAPADASWPGAEWPAVWTIVDDPSTTAAAPGDYSLYMVLTNYAGSVKTGVGGTSDPVRFTVP